MYCTSDAFLLTLNRAIGYELKSGGTHFIWSYIKFFKRYIPWKTENDSMQNILAFCDLRPSHSIAIEYQMKMKQFIVLVLQLRALEPIASQMLTIQLHLFSPLLPPVDPLCHLVHHPATWLMLIGLTALKFLLKGFLKL